MYSGVQPDCIFDSNIHQNNIFSGGEPTPLPVPFSVERRMGLGVLLKLLNKKHNKEKLL